MRERVETLLRDVIAPLLRKDGADAEWVSLEDQTLTIRVHGEAAFGAGAPQTRLFFIEKPLRLVAPDLIVCFEMARPKPHRR